MKNQIFHTYVTGLSHHRSYLLNLGAIQVGTVLTLERDPKNAFDPKKAIKVLFEGRQIGWIPKQDGDNTAQAVIANLMDTGAKLTCTVAAHDLTNEDVQRRLFVDVAVTSTFTSMADDCLRCSAALRKEGREEGITAGKALHLMGAFGPTVEIMGIVLPVSLVDTIKAAGVEEKRLSIANIAYNKGYNAGFQASDDQAKAHAARDLANTIGAILNGNISFYDVVAKALNITRAEAKKRWYETAFSRKNAPYEDMVVRVVRPEYYKTMSTLQLELRSAVNGDARSPMIPSLKVRPGDTVRVSIIERG